MRIRSLLALAAVGLLGAGCGTTRIQPVAPTMPATPAVSAFTIFVPAGVDTSVAVYADSLADESFVSVEAEERAAARADSAQQLVAVSDTLWKYLTMVQDTSYTVSDEDKQSAAAAFNEAGQLFAEFRQFSAHPDSSLDSTTIATAQAQLLDAAERRLEEALVLNPFADHTRQALATVYRYQADRLRRAEAYDRAIETLEKLVRLNPDQPPLFIQLASVYEATEQWDRAADAYRRAEEVYLHTYNLGPDQDPTAPPDTTVLFSYASAQGRSYVYDRDGSQARAHYERALALATSPEQEQAAQGWLDWIDWADGNLAASFARDSLVALFSQGNHAAAEQGFLRLKQQVHTPRAVDEIDWRLALVEYQLGKKDQAAERLQALVQRTEVDPRGYPVDSLYVRYFDDYGAICFNTGQEYEIDKRDRRTALKLYLQATTIPWERRPLANLRAASILRNNITEALTYAEDALREECRMPPEDRLDLYRLLSQLYRRQTAYDQARTFQLKYQELRAQLEAGEQPACTIAAAEPAPAGAPVEQEPPASTPQN